MASTVVSDAARYPGGVGAMEPTTKGEERSGAEQLERMENEDGNVWWIGTHIEDLSHEELLRRAAEARN
jgi:hypothetical protein